MEFTHTDWIQTGWHWRCEYGVWERKTVGRKSWVFPQHLQSEHNLCVLQCACVLSNIDNVKEKRVTVSGSPFQRYQSIINWLQGANIPVERSGREEPLNPRGPDQREYSWGQDRQPRPCPRDLAPPCRPPVFTTVSYHSSMGWSTAEVCAPTMQLPCKSSASERVNLWGDIPDRNEEFCRTEEPRVPG